MRWTMVDEMDQMGDGRWNGCDGLCCMKRMRWTMVDKMDEMDYGRRNGWDGLW